MATKTHIVWRKATEQELINGSPEMIIVKKEEIQFTEPEIDKIDGSKIDIEKLTNEQIEKLKKRLQ